MTSPHEQDMSHPLEQVTGERDVRPEEDDAREQATPSAPDEEADARPESGSEQSGGAP